MTRPSPGFIQSCTPLSQSHRGTQHLGQPLLGPLLLVEMIGKDMGQDQIWPHGKTCTSSTVPEYSAVSPALVFPQLPWPFPTDRYLPPGILILWKQL